ncbi:ras GTPase-activating protein 1-like [Gigantopelta aegis]|uniref:ras GTPase-activating protein 1-like n=1 Tax=Gigantopelta aegis TaxID=1735272 RepID=UPI001B88BFE8|nr:ras GTPase-activating protein 1-like [Gigantopelta aegis]
MADNNKFVKETPDTTAAVECTDDFDPLSGAIECVEEQIEGQLTAPDENLKPVTDYRHWYHGRLDRQTAEERLLAADIEGSYLVRESDRKPGSFVLSYLGKLSQLTHFKILAKCGDYYIGGRQFESLSDLIGYYTNWSCLLKGEQLVEPVQPPEPVDDRRRVVAMLSYSKMAETDELSFKKGDTFIVQNELINGWLWVTSGRTGESGIIPGALVEDLNGNIDPAEWLPYFHNNITKEEAVKKLTHAGEGGFLVRPSDNSPGAFSLFFLCEKEVMRFRIVRKGRQLFVGGRYFESLDAIIQRYKKEEIVEGYKLTKAVCRENFDTFDGQFKKTLTVSERNVLYASIMRSGPNLLTSKSELTGYLLKRSEKTKKWKLYYFVLNGSERLLYFFENERRSRPKGLIELSYSALYPVHDSFFSRPNCFQIVSNFNNNQVQVCYLSADNPDTVQKWIQSVKPYIGADNDSCLKEFHSVTINVFEAHQLPNKLLNHPYAVVSLGSVKVSRTEVGEAPNPVWEEEFVLDDIPADVEVFTVSLYNKVKRSRDTEIAHVTLDLRTLDLRTREYVEEWFGLQAATPNNKTDMGTLRLKAHYTHEVVMPYKEYTSLKELILAEDYNEIIQLSKVCAKSEWIVMCKSLLRIFCYEKQEASLLRTLTEMEIDREAEVSQIFRATTLATTMMDQYMKLAATQFVESAVKDSVLRIMESKQSCEVNPALLDNAADARPNQEYFLSLLNGVTETIFKSIDYCPVVLRYVCSCLQKKVVSKWPDDETVKTRVVSGFIFLRLICPAILSPKLFNLVLENPSETAARTLKLVVKSLQNLANLVESGTKEAYMEVVKPFIKRNREKLVMFLDALSNVPENSTVDADSVLDPSRDLATIHRLCSSHLEDLRALVEEQPSLRKLVSVTEMLTKHKKVYMGDT